MEHFNINININQPHDKNSRGQRLLWVCDGYEFTDYGKHDTKSFYKEFMLKSKAEAFMKDKIESGLCVSFKVVRVTVVSENPYITKARVMVACSIDDENEE